MQGLYAFLRLFGLIVAVLGGLGTLASRLARKEGFKLTRRIVP